MPTPRHPSLLSDFDVFFHYSLVVVFFFFLTHWAQRLLGEQSRLTIWVVVVHEEAHDVHCDHLLPCEAATIWCSSARGSS